MALSRLAAIFLALPALLPAQSRDLQIIWNDVEGGAATLIVTPAGQSLLVDTGWNQNNGRDAKRIVAAAKAAGITKIDALITTHFHTDHVGGTPGLAQMIPIEKFYDHGDSIEANTPQGAQLYDAYKTLAAGKRVTVKPGDKIPLAGVEITAVSAAGQVLAKAINGGGKPNEYCKDVPQKPEDKTENGQSVGFLLTYGKFKFVDLGDLTWDREMMLACPNNKLGTISLFQASHHGFSSGQSGSPALVFGLKPQVVIVNDGARKGFDAAAYAEITKIPGIEAIWQLHRAAASTPEQNTAPDMTANLEEGAADQGFGIKVTVAKDGKFTVTNLRNNFSKTYTSK
ncbi:MAG TPA: MBL fold metallo-hydrolase [Bryobacteraceae bacterium]|jgi:beta-lactamase superfamily II metal-dependent hydrolase